MAASAINAWGQICERIWSASITFTLAPMRASWSHSFDKRRQNGSNSDTFSVGLFGFRRRTRAIYSIERDAFRAADASNGSKGGVTRTSSPA